MDPLQRPIGWWLKEADRALDDTFESALTGAGADRSDWQMLNALSHGESSVPSLVAALSGFDDEEAVRERIALLCEQGLAELSGGVLILTDAGREQHATLAPLVADVRRQVAEALPGEEYAVLVRSLARLVDALE